MTRHFQLFQHLLQDAETMGAKYKCLVIVRTLVVFFFGLAIVNVQEL